MAVKLSVARYRTWTVDHWQVCENVRYLCLEFIDPPDDWTLMALQKSEFMYGYLDGAEQACWHAVLTAEAHETLDDILSD